MVSETNAGQGVTPADSAINWKTKAYVIGALGGLLLGLLSAYLYARTYQENNRQPQGIKTGDAMKLTLALLALVRQISELGSRS